MLLYKPAYIDYTCAATTTNCDIVATTISTYTTNDCDYYLRAGYTATTLCTAALLLYHNNTTNEWYRTVFFVGTVGNAETYQMMQQQQLFY